LIFGWKTLLPLVTQSQTRGKSLRPRWFGEITLDVKNTLGYESWEIMETSAKHSLVRLERQYLREIE
jgi:hypothetical protein